MKTKTFLSRIGSVNTPPCLRKSTTSLKALLLLLGLVLSVNLSAETKTSTLIFTAKCNGSGTADDDVSWTISSDADESDFDSQNSKGIHYGTGKKAVSYLTLTTDGIEKTITKIVVNASGASKTSATISATVNGNAFGTQNQSITASAANYTFTGSASGKIVISLNQTSATKALYVKSIVVTYEEEGDDPSCTSRTITFAGNPTTVEKTTADAAFKYAASIDVADGQTIGYTSSDTKVATVAADGTVTIVGAGTTEITASVPAKDTYCEASASYTVNVTKPVFSCWEGSLNCDFTSISGFSEWSSTYSQHVVNYTNLTVTFASANKNTGTITDCPVTKGRDVIFVAAEQKVITQIHVNCKQWTDKKQTITLNYSTDGGTNYSTLTPSVTSEDFEIESTSLPEGTNAVKLTFSSADNQIGIASACVTIEDAATLNSISVKTAPKTTYNAGEFFNPAGLVITATYDATTKDITYDANDTKWEFIPELTEKLTGKDDAVAITYNGVTIDPFLDITVNRIASNLTAVSATKILVVDDAPSLSDWYTIDADYDGTIAFSSDDTEVFDVLEGTGLALEAGSATLTITAPQTNVYAEASISIEVTVNAAAVPCSVKWMNNSEEYTEGEPSTSVKAGQKVTQLPTDPTPCDDQHAFMGWTAKTISDGQAPSDLFKTAADAPTVDADNTIYYAVYAVESQDEDIDSYNFASFTSAQIVEFETTSGNTIKMDKGEGSNNPAWNAGASEARLYAKGSMTVSSAETISKIVYTYVVNANSKGVSPTIDGVEGKTNAGTWDSENKTWTGSDTEITFSTSGSAGNVGFTNVTIYTAGELTYSDYSTTCAGIKLDKIELSGTYPTTFLVGDEFSHEGMTVTASYTNSSKTKDVTTSATFSGYNANTLGEQTITVSYTEGEGESAITETTTYKVTVNDLPTKTIAQFLADPSKCYLSGIVSNITNTTYGNYTLTDASGSAEIYGTLTPSKESKQFSTLGIEAGDKIKVIAEGYSSQYKNIPNVIFVEELELTAIAVSGTMTNKEYTAGNTLSPEGLVVKSQYSDEAEAMHEITEGITWNMPTAELGFSEYDVTATVGTLNSPAYHVTGITVNAPKVLESLSMVGTPKETYWVGEQFNYDGLVFKAKYENDDNLVDVTSLCTFSREAGQITDAIDNETITVSYTEGSITKKVEFVINANWMTLADLVAKGQPSTDAVKVWVKVTDAEIKAKSYSYITTDVIYGDNQTQEVKIYKSGVSSDWEEGGKISGNLKDVDWKHYTGGGNDDWELMPTNWDWVTSYTAPYHTPVTGVSLNPETISITQGRSEQLTATITPENAYDKAVTWSIINDNTTGKVTVDQNGKVSVAKDAAADATATVQVKTHDGDFTATCVVTVTAPQVKYFAIATSTADLDAAITNGKKVVIAPAPSVETAKVMGTYASGNNIAAMDAEFNDEYTALEVGEDAFYTIAKDGDYYTFQDGNSKYIYAAGGTGTNNHLKAKADLEATGKWTVAINATTKAATIKTSDNTVVRHTIMFNSGSTLFACYASGQSAVALYVEAEKPVYVPVGSIELNETSADVMVGKTITLTATVGPDNATQKGVTWTSNNDKVTVEDGIVTVAADATVGSTATITATTVGTTTDGGSEHLSATCTITVTELVATKYGLVSNINTLYDGAVVVLGAVYEKDSETKYAVSGAIGTDMFMASVEVDATDYADEVMASDGATEITLHQVEGGWTMTSDEGNIYLSGSDIKVNTTTDATIWTISIEDGVATIANGTNVFRYNTTSPRFKTYTSNTGVLPGIYLKNFVTVRTGLTAGKLGTFCEAKAFAVSEGAEFYDILNKDANSKNVTLQEAESQHAAGMPYIIIPTDDIIKVLFTGEAAEAQNNNGLYGWLSDDYNFNNQIDNQDAYFVNGGKIKKCGANCTILKNRAYIVMENVPSENTVAPAPGRRRITLGVESTDTPTGFDYIFGKPAEAIQKLIINNQLIIIRHGHFYNAAGARMK